MVELHQIVAVDSCACTHSYTKAIVAAWTDKKFGSSLANSAVKYPSQVDSTKLVGVLNYPPCSKIPAFPLIVMYVSN